MIKNNIDITIKNYLSDDTYSYAILIDGQWGEGKTFYIKNMLPEIAKGKKIIYVSLFSKNNVYDIRKAVNISFVLGFTKKKFLIKNVDKVSKIFKNIESVICKKYPNITADLNIFDYLKKKSEYLLVFDDLERCGLKIVDVLGIINEYVENNGIKTIIVTNSKKINDSELKDYEKYIEKVVGTRISYEVDYLSTTKQICEKLKINRHINNKKMFSFYLEMSNLLECKNLRTFEFFLSKSNYLLTLIDCEKYKDIVEDVIKCCFISCIEYKKNLNRINWKDNKFVLHHIKTKNEDEDMFALLNNYISFKFVDDYVRDCLIDEDIEKILDEFLESKKNNDNSIVDELNDWYIMSESELLKKLDEVMIFIKSDNNHLSIMPSLIKNIVYLSSYKIISEEKFLELVKCIIDNIDVNCKYEIIDWDCSFLDEKQRILYNNTVSKIKETIKNKNGLFLIKLINKALKKEKWADELVELDKEYFQLDSFVKYVDINELAFVIEKSDNYNISILRKLLNSKYGRFTNTKEIYGDNLNYLKELRDALLCINTSNFDSIKLFNFNLMLENIKKYIEKLK